MENRAYGFSAWMLRTQLQWQLHVRGFTCRIFARECPAKNGMDGSNTNAEVRIEVRLVEY
jgi:hypothetical protein